MDEASVNPISETESLRQELDRFKARLDLALNAGRMGAWQFDAGTGRVTWTATLEIIHGLEPGTFGGTFEDYQKDIHPDDREYVLTTIGRSLTGKSPHQLTYRIVRPDGAVRWLEASGKLIDSSDGSSFQMMGVCCDVTDRIAAEEQRQELLKQAEAAVQARDSLVAMVSHDLRTPLNIVAICSEVIGARTQAEDHETARDIERIGRAVTQMSTLISDLLDAESIEVGSFRIRKAQSPVAEIVSNAIDEFQPLASQENMTLQTVGGEIEGQINCDAARIRQVLGNLLSNAIKYAPQNTAITLKIERRGPDYVFSVQDRGPGIPQENTTLVFDRYWRGKQSGRAGTGLGLYISRGIVLAHGGDMSVESVLGEGSTFSFSLPAS